MESFGKAFMGRGKRGQATIFIILGIIVIIIAVASSYLQSESFREKVQSIAFRSVAVPEQAQGVVNYVSSCIEEFTVDGIEIMELQGGYISIPENIRENPILHLKFNENTIIPYWLYGEGSVQIPSISEIETDLENYINERLNDECSLDGYRQLGYDISEEEMGVDVSINNKDIIIDLNTDLRASIKEEEFDLDKYVLVSISSRLREFYEMGNDIIDRELRDSPLEFNTLNLISIYGHHPSGEIPPLASMALECGSKKWLKPNVREVLRNIISENTAKLRVEGSVFNPIDNVFYESMLIDNVFDRNHDASVKFNYYTDWDFFLDIKPNKGLVVEGDNYKLGGIPFLPIFCLKNYDFKYDVRYPLLVEIADEKEIFRFPIEVIIKDNYGRRRLGDERVDSEVELLLCEEGQRNSGEVEISSWDAKTNEILEGVDVVFNCVEQFCAIGKTSIDDFGISRYVSKFPRCEGGEIILSKDGYLAHRETLDTYIPTENPGEQSAIPPFYIDAYLEPLREVKINVKVLDIENNVISERNLGDDEVVIIQINRHNFEFGEADFQTSITFGGDEDIDTVELVPADGNAIYQIQSTLVSKRRITIPSYNLGNGVILPATDLDEFIIGGGDYEWVLRKNKIGNELGLDDLDDNDEITFYVLSKGVPENYLELQAGYDFSEESLEFSEQLRPRLKKNE